MLEFCRRMAVPVFVFVSSSSVYGPGNPLPAVSSPTTRCRPAHTR